MISLSLERYLSHFVKICYPRPLTQLNYIRKIVYDKIRYTLESLTNEYQQDITIERPHKDKPQVVSSENRRIK